MKEPDLSKTHAPARIKGVRQVRAQESPLKHQVLVPTEDFIHSKTILRLAGRGRDKSGRKRNRA